MSDHDVLDRAEPRTDEAEPRTQSTDAFVDFLESEFPAWTFAIDRTSTWGGEDRLLWIATRDGHHPQSELSAGKLHRRLSDYEARETARHAGAN